MLFSRRRHQPLLRLTTRRNLNLLPGLNSWDHYTLSSVFSAFFPGSFSSFLPEAGYGGLRTHHLVLSCPGQFYDPWLSKSMLTWIGPRDPRHAFTENRALS